MNLTVTVVEALTVHFDANGGTGEMAAQFSTQGAKVTLPACGFTAPAGKIFTEWLCSADEQTYQPDASFEVNEEVTFTAQWTDAATVTFNANGGSEVEAQVFVSGECATEPAKPTRAGYDFLSWTKDNETFDFTTPVTEDIELVALWMRNPTALNETFEDIGPGWSVDGIWEIRSFTTGHSGTHFYFQN